MAEYTVTTHDPLVESIVERFNKMGVRLVVEQDQAGDYRVSPSPAVYFVHRRDNTAHRMRPSFNGSRSPQEALRVLDEDVQNKCMRGTSYVHGQCRLLVEDPSREDYKVFEFVDRIPVDTGNRAQLVPE